METTDCQYPDNCQANHLGCDCKPPKKKKKKIKVPETIKRFVVVTTMIGITIGLWAFLFYLIKGVK